MLAGTWDYTHPRTGEVVYNVEGLCRSILDRGARRLARRLEPADYEESLSFLLGEVVVLADKYDPERATSFGDFLHARLGFRLVDSWRRFYGSSGHKRVVDLGALERARRDAGVEADGRTEQADDRLEACVEEIVVGYADLSRVAPLRTVRQ